jgi:hypothetical protein
MHPPGRLRQVRTNLDDAGLPLSAAWALGLLVGINLVFGGSALIAMALHVRFPPISSPSCMFVAFAQKLILTPGARR